MIKLITVLCVFAVFVIGGDGYRILGVFPAPAYSHYSLASRLMKALAEKGHDVTIVAPFKEKNPPKNYREIVLEDLKRIVDGKKIVKSFKKVLSSDFCLFKYIFC